MTVERGAAWGSPNPLPEDGVVVHTDAELRTVVEAARRANASIPAVGLLGGDLCRTLGGSGDEARLRSPEATTFPVDIVAVLVDGVLHWFTAHLVARRPWWRGRVVAVMNAQFLGRWDVAPRSHPGDGRIEVLDARLSLSEQLQARRRLPTGSHLPHPKIATRSVRSWQTDLDPRTEVWLDGSKLSRARQLSIRVEPDALRVVV
jgi:diacylglycerol kinase family enzyme